MTEFALAYRRLNNKSKRAKKDRTYTIVDYYNISIMVLLTFAIIVSTIYPQVINANGPTGSIATYEHLMDGTFYNEGGTSSKAAALMQKVAAWVLNKILPFMTIYALTIMVISMSSTVIYLSNPDLFDEVHHHHRMRKEAKKSRKGFQSVGEFMKMVSGGDGVSFIKGVIIPDVKAQAFYEACEIGEDGRPSMATFFKYSFPKYIIIIAMIIMINDRTMLDLYFRGAEIGVFFFQKAAYDFNYPDMIQRFLNTGGRYDPGWKGNKKSLFTKIYTAALNLDKSDGTETAEYKQKVGSLVAKKMEDSINKKIDFDGYKVASHVRIDTIPYAQGNLPEFTWQWKASDLGVRAGDMEKYITVTVSLTDRNKTSSLETSETTTYQSAWSGVSKGTKTITFDLTQTPWVGDVKTDANNQAQTEWSGYGVASQPVVIYEGNQTEVVTATFDAGKVNIKLSNSSGLDVMKLTFQLKTPSGNRQVRYVNADLINKSLNPTEDITQ